MAQAPVFRFGPLNWRISCWWQGQKGLRTQMVGLSGRWVANGFSSWQAQARLPHWAPWISIWLSCTVRLRAIPYNMRDSWSGSRRSCPALPGECECEPTDLCQQESCGCCYQKVQAFSIIALVHCQVGTWLKVKSLARIGCTKPMGAIRRGFPLHARNTKPLSATHVTGVRDSVEGCRGGKCL